MSSFTPDVAASLEGPDWLVKRRAAAAERASSQTLPTPDEEVWRYSRIAEFELEEFSPVVDSAGGGIPKGAQDVLDAIPERAGVVVTRNGRLVHTELRQTWVDKGLYVGPLAGADRGEEALGSVAAEPTDLFAEMNEAFSAEPILINVPAGVTVTEPIVVLDWIDADGGAVFPRLVVQAGADSDVNVLDWHGSDDVHAFAAPVIELDAQRSARLRYLNVMNRGGQMWQIASQVSRADNDATVVATQATLGGYYARTRADCQLVGRGATGNLAAIYFGEGDQMMDFRTFQDHAAPDTTSNLLFKGVVGDRSQSVYTGLIRVRKNARGTNAFQTNRNIKLSEQAWAESVPNLEIENNDVHCSHASTVGPIDEDQRFYLESRGVPTPVAERLIVAGFFEEVIARLPVPVTAPLLRAMIGDRLDRRVS